MVNPQTMPMNREQRRKHYKESANDKTAILCPKCKHKTKHISLPNNKQIGATLKEVQSELTDCQVVCVACGNILKNHYLAIPYTYICSV